MKLTKAKAAQVMLYIIYGWQTAVAPCMVCKMDYMGSPNHIHTHAYRSFDKKV